MKTIQLNDVNGEPLGLYQTEETDNQIEFDDDFQECFDLANDKDDDDVTVQERADEYLEQRGIYRIFAEEINLMNNI